jgi:hypothetical protein
MPTRLRSIYLPHLARLSSDRIINVKRLHNGVQGVSAFMVLEGGPITPEQDSLFLGSRCRVLSWVPCQLAARPKNDARAAETRIGR